MSIETQSPQNQFQSTKFIIKVASDQLIINNQPINYGSQILDVDKLYIVKATPNSNLKTPIILTRTKQVDELDRRMFMKKFTLEIVKGLQICSIQDAVFIIGRVPKNIKYFVSIIQKITLIRWQQLLNRDSFFIAFYQVLEQLISKREMSKLRSNYIEDLLQTKLKAIYSRLYFLLDNLVLEDESLRNSLINLTRMIVFKQMQEKYFFDRYLFGNQKSEMKDQEDDQNSGIQDNKSQNQSVQQDKEMKFPQAFIQNTVNVLKSCQKLKMNKEFITKKILNVRFFKILKNFFQTLFERQRILLLELLAIVSEIEPLQMWKITFQEGRTMRCKSLLYLESLLTNSMLNYSQNLKKPIKQKKLLINSSFSGQPKQNVLSIMSYESWQFTSVVLQKFMTFQSPQRKVFLNKILNSLLTCKLIHEELECILIFLDSSLKDEIYCKKNVQIWKMIVVKIEKWLNEIKKSSTKVDGQKIKIDKKMSATKKQKKNMLMQLDNDSSFMSMIQEQEGNYSTSTSYEKRSTRCDLRLPMSKPKIITLMKIYKLLISNEKKFELILNPQCIVYLLDMTQKRKGIIQGVRLTLIEVIGKESSYNEVDIDNESSSKQMSA